MNRTLVLIVTHRGISQHTLSCLDAMPCNRMTITGISDISHARSVAFDRALAAIEGTEVDTILTLDDDMVFRPADAQRLVDLSRASGIPTSAIALASDGRPTAHPFPQATFLPGLRPRPRWLTGLAFTAFPRVVLEQHAKRLERLGDCRVWCLSGKHPRWPNTWTSEDMWLATEMGGFDLAPIAVGHVKPCPLWPDDKTIASFFAEAELQARESP